MIETYKILHNLYDHNCSIASLLKLHASFYVRETRGHRLNYIMNTPDLKGASIVSQSDLEWFHYGTPYQRKLP